MSSQNPSFYIGLMSGTSLDGVDGVLASFPPDFSGAHVSSLASFHVPFSVALREELMALQARGSDEIHREAMAASQLARHYAQCVKNLLAKAEIDAKAIRAIGVHGQTIRHQPALGYTRQTNNPALLAELSGIDVIADFRSRDIAAGGQGAPLVPAFHQAVFGDTAEIRVVVNIGGIGNISVLGSNVIGFDTGPGNVLLDLWTMRHLGQPYDASGAWAATGQLIPDLLEVLKNEAFFRLAPPKSTGRDLFDAAWLNARLSAFGPVMPCDVQATLTALTAVTIADAIAGYAKGTQAVYVCGGGAFNDTLMQRLREALTGKGVMATVDSTEVLGISANHVEALAFAWLAHRFTLRQPGNISAVTGAAGPRILGALYPA